MHNALSWGVGEGSWESVMLVIRGDLVSYRTIVGSGLVFVLYLVVGDFGSWECSQRRGRE